LGKIIFNIIQSENEISMNDLILKTEKTLDSETQGGA